MPLTSGARLGSYEVISPLGSGGMGEVYRARDTKLGRDVAIKILPHRFTDDPDRLARFEREARVLASLNHPHIGAIYGLEQAADLRGLVLELVEGQTLAERIARAGGPSGPSIPIREALEIARQIADALDAAHEKGIIHRDLKPANIKITPEGIVKVLDFGLAKAASVDASAPDLTQSPTVTLRGTREGILLGTAAYMSPEQARGKPVDKRTDIWAFGCVLYELLTGRAPFAGETVSDTIAAILEREPFWGALPAETPAAIKRLLQRCLDKDPKRRLRDIGDARAELDDAVAAPSAAPAAANTARARTSPRRFVAFACIAVGIAAVCYVLFFGVPGTGNQAAPIPAGFTQLTAQPGVELFPSLSPDGKWVVYTGEDSGNRDIYLQSVSGQTPINLTKDSTADDDQPAFSPDGERIAFRSSRDGGGIFVMGRTSEAVRRVTRTGFRPAWSPDGKELAFTTENIDVNPLNGQCPCQLWIAAIDSGELRRLDAGDAVQVSWSPHGQRIAYVLRFANSLQLDIWTISVAGGAPVPLITGVATDWNPVWSPDGKYLYFTSDRRGSMNLWRVPVDEQSGKATGDAQPVTTPAPFAAHPSISADGARIAYSSVLVTQNIQKLVIDPETGVVKGQPEWLTTGSRPWSSPDPSPDGQWIAFYSRLQPEGDLYIARADGTGLRQVTGDAAFDRLPRWSPDSRRIAFFSNRGTNEYELWQVAPDGSELQQLTEANGALYPVWSPDGSRIAVTVAPQGTGRVYIFNPNRPWKQQTPELLPPFEPPSTLFVVNSWSADGERLAGQMGLAGKGLATYSLRSRTYERLTDVGEWPVWFPDNRHLLFVVGGKDLMMIDTKTKAVRKVFSSTHDVLGPPRLTRDGREAYFSRRITEADVWLLTLN